tara:strand:- start:265 stop:1002 length:738 start_codon:yes stop_codon:yes gene_type:complete
MKDSITDGLGLPRTGIQNDVIQEAVSKYNFCGRTIWDAWPWDSKKIDQFDTASASVSNFDTATGIITFAANVDLIRGVQAANPNATDGGLFVWNESEINMAMRGESVSSGRFKHLSDTDAGLRRIQVAVDDNVATYNILATKTFTKAIIDPAYSSVTPSATPTDYRVILFPLDKADQALQAYISDQLRLWDGQPQRNDWDALLRVAIGTQENQEQRTHQLIVPSPAFADVGRFEYGGNWGTAKTY